MSSSPLATWFIFIQTVIILDANWISGGSTLYPSYNFAVGSYGDAIFLIGGLSFTNFVQRHVVQYEINGDKFTHVKSLLEEDEDIFGSGQFWTQQNEILYTIRPTISDSGTSTFVIFNMNTKQLEFDWNNIQIPINVCQSGCLASSNAHLFVVGGADCASPSQPLATLQALRLSTYEWLQNAPSMNTARGDHACVVHSNYLWVFGGDTATNERIDTTNIAVESWNYTAPLPQPIYSLRAVAWEHFIYIIGGWIEPSNVHVALSTMYIMDVQTESITLSPHVLPTATRSAGTILVGDGIYVFGGLDQGGMEITQWMYYKLSTLNPSAATPAPSHVPSHLPSSAPTGTNLLLGWPSKNPSEISSSSPPSTSPTRSPSAIAQPSRIPERSITNDPSTGITTQPTIEIQPTKAYSLFDNKTLHSTTIVIRSTSISTTNAESTRTTDYNTAITAKTTKRTISNAFDPLQLSDDLLVPIISLVITSILCICLIILLCFKRDLWRLPARKEKEMIEIVSEEVQHNVIEPGAEGMDRNGDTRADRVDYVDVETQELTPMHMRNKVHQDALELQYWLESVVGLAHYFEAFMDNGYESLEFVKAISNMNEVIDIGIHSKQHQVKIWEEILKLEGEEHNQYKQDKDCTSTVSTLGEGRKHDTQTPNPTNAADFIHSVANDEIVVGDNETNIGGTTQQ
eukprot:303588_1